MLGNVWEWTRTRYTPRITDCQNEVFALDKNGARVVRGGSFRNDRDCARCACRSSFGPGTRVINIGFRLALCSVRHETT